MKVEYTILRKIECHSCGSNVDVLEVQYYERQYDTSYACRECLEELEREGEAEDPDLYYKENDINE